MKNDIYISVPVRYDVGVTRSEAWAAARGVWKTASEAIGGLEKSIDPEAFSECVRVLAACRGRIATSGAGTSAAAARKIAHSLCCVERPAFFLSPADAVHGGLGAVQEGDVAILISKGGNTREIVNLLPALTTKRVYVVAVTENPDSTLARSCNLLLRVRVEREADEFNMLATTSTMAVVAVFDAACIALMRATGYTKERFAVIHPGGAVGERLLGAAGGAQSSAPAGASRGGGDLRRTNAESAAQRGGVGPGAAPKPKKRTSKGKSN